MKIRNDWNWSKQSRNDQADFVVLIACAVATLFLVIWSMP